MNDVHTVENFYGVYLLYCTNPKYLGRTYIGYTVDPNRRIKQHNKGKKAGGAWKTSNKGPWVMAMIIHGFPNDIAALRFEWAWQHPQASRRLNHVPKKKTKEKTFDYSLRILSEMFRVGPWNRLPLTIRWLNQEFCKDFTVDKQPPIHMPICYGTVISKKVSKLHGDQTDSSQDEVISAADTCKICFEIVADKKMMCLNPKCDFVGHVVCWSDFFLEPGQYVPIEGKCPGCGENFLWGDLVRKYRGCYSALNIDIDPEMGNDFYSSDSD